MKAPLVELDRSAVADEIEEAKNLVDAAGMAAACLPQGQSAPLAELLDHIGRRLQEISRKVWPVDEVPT